MKKIILAINNKKLEKMLLESNNKIEITFNKLQYREAILEILEKNKNIDFILIDENLPGIISIEELIRKIKLINNKINILIFLKKENINKINILKSLNIKNIYLNKKIDINKIIKIIIKDNNYEKYKELKNNIKYKKTNDRNNIKNKLFKINILEGVFTKIKKHKNINVLKNEENKLITIVGKRKTGKSTITNFLLIYLLEKNKKILLINLNKKIEHNYLVLFGKKYYKIKNNYLINNKNKKEAFLKSEIKINNNLIFLNNFQQIIQQNNYNNILEYFTRHYIKKYDYILVDIGDNANKKIKEKIIEKSNKTIIILTNDLLGIKQIDKIRQKLNNLEEKEKKSLHIILNKYYFNLISNSIFKNLIKKKIKINTIFYNQKYINLQDKILKKEKMNLNTYFLNKLKNILN